MNFHQHQKKSSREVKYLSAGSWDDACHGAKEMNISWYDMEISTLKHIMLKPDKRIAYQWIGSVTIRRIGWRLCTIKTKHFIDHLQRFHFSHGFFPPVFLLNSRATKSIDKSFVKNMSITWLREGEMMAIIWTSYQAEHIVDIHRTQMNLIRKIRCS